MNRLLLWFALFFLVAHTALGAVTDIVIYDDTSHNPPFDQTCSFNGVPSDYIFNNTAPVHSGSASIRFIPEHYNAVSWCGNTTYSTASYSAITFWVYLGSAAQGDNIDFVLSTQSTVNGAASLNTIYGAAIPVGVWTQLHTKFASAPLNYTGAFDHISFQDETGATNYDIFGNSFDAATPLANIYFDDVVLQSAATLTYSVTAGAPGGNGSIAPPAQVVASGATASFTVTPNAGYHVTSVLGDTCTITQQGATTTWISSAITQACAVTATFAISSYTVTPSVNGGNGTISPNTPQSVIYNATKSFTLAPNTGYHIGSVGGTCGGSLGGSTYTTSAVTANCTVIANFAINTYTLAYNHDPNGTISGTTPQTVNYGASGAAVTAVPNASYHFAQWSDASIANPRTDSNVQANITVTAQFASDMPPPACGLVDHKNQDVVLDAGQLKLNSDVFDWCDSLAHPREAVLVHNDVTGNFNGDYTNHGGALQRFSYQLSGGGTRTATVTTYGNGGYGGFGYVVSHSADSYCAGDDSPLGFNYKGTWTLVFEGRHHAIFRFQQNYQRHCGPNPSPPTTLIPVTIDWVFSTGRDNPVWAITYDMSGTAANFLYDDSRAPYGELNIDGDGSTPIDGTAWGDKYKFASTTAPVTLSSSWTWNTPNAVPYVKEWLTAAHGDATMGVVQTQTIDQQDAGGGRTAGYYPDDTLLWTTTSLDGNGCVNHPYTHLTYLMPCQDNWPYQANNDSIGVGVSNNNSRLTWGTQYGFLGQSSYASNLNAGNPDHGPNLPGWPKKSYSVFVVLGQHSTSPVETQVTQVETAQTLTFTFITGSVVTSGPAGINRADTVTYDPPGYDQIYGALAFNAASNVLDANINVGSGTLKKPLIIVHGYTSGSYPTSVKLNGAALTMDTDYFPSLRGAASELWITLNKDLAAGSNHLEINTSSAAPSQFRGTTITGMESGFNGAGTQHVCLQAGGPVAGTDYPVQDTRLIDYFASKSASMLRPLFAWECMQPVLNGPIPGSNTPGNNYKTYFDYYKTMVDYATNTKGMGIIVEPWEAASDNSIGGAMYNGNLVGSAQVPRSAFADFWNKMATIFKDNPRVSYGLMSEPNHMSTSSWFASAQAAITAIRAAGSTQRIYVPGNAYTGASTWTMANAYGGDATSNADGWLNANGAGMPLTDPANNIAVEVHTYVDCYQGGLYDEITSNTAARDQLDVTVQWARPHSLRVYLGEIGIYAGNAPVYNPDPGCAVHTGTATLAWADFVNYANANTDTLAGFTWWAGGYPGWWDDLHGPHFSITPTNGATFTGDSVEMTLIQGSF